MFGIGGMEFVVIIIVALLVLGPKNLAKVSRTVGKYMGEFRRATTDFQRSLNVEVAEEERKEAKEKIKQQAEAARAARAKRVEAEEAKEKEVPTPNKEKEEAVVMPPEGSPLEAALRKAQAEANPEQPTLSLEKKKGAKA